MSPHPRHDPSTRLRRVLVTTAAAIATAAAVVVVAAPAQAVPLPRPGVSRTGTSTPAPPVRWTAKTPIAPVTRTPVVTTDPAVAEVVRLVNVERAKVANCPALRVDARLATAARLHSEDMARQDYFSHTSLDGRSPWDRIAAQGYTGASGENIAAGYRTAAAVMTGWMNSSGHRANILNCTSRAIGVGIGYGGSYGLYWTQTFGRV